MRGLVEGFLNLELFGRREEKGDGFQVLQRSAILRDFCRTFLTNNLVLLVVYLLG